MKKLNIVVASLFTLSALGFLGYLVIATKTSEQQDDRKKTSEKEFDEEIENNTRLSNESQDKTNKVDVTELNVPECIKETVYETVDQLVTDILYYYIHTGNVVSPENLLTNLIRICQKKIEYLNMDWFEKLPKNVEELENLIRDLELWDAYTKAF